MNVGHGWQLWRAWALWAALWMVACGGGGAAAPGDDPDGGHLNKPDAMNGDSSAQPDSAAQDGGLMPLGGLSPEQFFELTVADSDEGCLNVAGFGQLDFNEGDLIQWPCATTSLETRANDVWRFLPFVDGSYQIEVKGFIVDEQDVHCLSGNKNTNTGAVRLESCSDFEDSAVWMVYIEHAGVRIVNRATGECLLPKLDPSRIVTSGSCETADRIWQIREILPG